MRPPIKGVLHSIADDLDADPVLIVMGYELERLGVLLRLESIPGLPEGD